MDWQTMDTAPTSGRTLVDLWIPHRIPNCWYDDGWYYYDRSLGYVEITERLTHWCAVTGPT